MSESSGISLQELHSLTQVIKKKYGIDFTGYEQKSLGRRVNRAIKVLKLEGVLGLWSQVLRDPKFIYTFIDELTVGMTSMFRDPGFWIQLQGLLEEDHFGKDRLKVWHAGCSTGEEVYSLGILMKHLKKPYHIRAQATDLNSRSVEASEAGEYNELILKEYEKNFAEWRRGDSLFKYAQPASRTSWKLDPALVEHVDFKVHNLVTDDYGKGYDIIFCRNVLIYFDDELKIDIMQRFHDALNPNGLFVLGYYDSIMPILNRNIFEIFDDKAKIFRKKSAFSDAFPRVAL